MNLASSPGGPDAETRPSDGEPGSTNTPSGFHSGLSHDIGEVLVNKPASISDVQKYTYLKDHVKPPAEMFSKVITKGGKLVTLTYQESWMSGGRACLLSCAEWWSM